MLESNDDDAHGLICLCVGEKSGGGEEREGEKMSEVNFPAASHRKNDNAENGCPARTHARASLLLSPLWSLPLALVVDNRL
jgi:hypothetical protein